MAYTETDLIREVLRDLGALDATGSVSPEDSAAVQVMIAPVVADLAQRRVATIASTASIAASVFADLVRLVAERVAPRFGRPTNDATVEAARLGIREADRLDRNTASSALTRAVLDRLDVLGASSDAIDAAAVAGAVAPTLADLAARRVIVFASEAAVTAAALPHVVVLVAARCVPKAVPQALVAESESALRSMARLDRAQATPLVRAVLEQLEIWGAGQSSIDGTTVAGRIAPTLASLAARNVIYIDDEDNVPDSAVLAVGRYIAAYLTPKPIGDVIAGAEAELRTLSRIGKETGRHLRVDRALLGRHGRCF